MALTGEGKTWLAAAVKRVDMGKMVQVLAEPRSIGMGCPKDLAVVEEMRRVFEAPGLSWLDPKTGPNTACATCGMEVVLGPNVAAKQVDVVLCPVCSVVFSAMTGAEPEVADGLGPEEEHAPAAVS